MKMNKNLKSIQYEPVTGNGTKETLNHDYLTIECRFISGKEQLEFHFFPLMKEHVISEIYKFGEYFLPKRSNLAHGAKNGAKKMVPEDHLKLLKIIEDLMRVLIISIFRYLLEIGFLSVPTNLIN